MFMTRQARLVARLTVIGILTLSSLANAGHFKLEADMDPLIKLPDAYQLKAEDLEQLYPKGNFETNPYFEWLTSKKDRAIFKRSPADNVEVNLTILEGSVPIEEVIVDFENGKFLGVTVSLFNTGDSEQLSSGEFAKRFEAAGDFISTQLDVKPLRRQGHVKKGVMTHGHVWSSPRGKAVLLCNPDIEDPLKPAKMEFMRMRLARKEAGGIYAAALQDRSQATVRKSRLAKNVKKKSGNVFITGIPMVDQGNKGYCVVASIQRLFEYYGIACDMHQLAQLAESDPEKGTDVLYINQQLGSIDYLFKTRYKCLAVSHEGRLVQLKDDRFVGRDIPSRSYYKLITQHVDDGIPLLWAMELGIKPEDPEINQQASGGHMRIIVGYNRTEKKIIFTDSWGAGHEYKTMDAEDSMEVTRALFILTPTVN